MPGGGGWFEGPGTALACDPGRKVGFLHRRQDGPDGEWDCRIRLKEMRQAGGSIVRGESAQMIGTMQTALFAAGSCDMIEEGGQGRKGEQKDKGRRIG